MMIYVECKETHKHFCARCGLIPLKRTYSQEVKESRGGLYLIKICESCMSELELKAYKSSLVKAARVAKAEEVAEGQISLIKK